MTLVEQIAKLSQELPEEKQAEVLDFVEFLTSRQPLKAWTVGERQCIVAKTMGRLPVATQVARPLPSASAKRKPKKTAGGNPKS